MKNEKFQIVALVASFDFFNIAHLLRAPVNALGLLCLDQSDRSMRWGQVQIAQTGISQQPLVRSTRFSKRLIQRNNVFQADFLPSGLGASEVPLSCRFLHKRQNFMPLGPPHMEFSSVPAL